MAKFKIITIIPYVARLLAMIMGLVAAITMAIAKEKGGSTPCSYQVKFGYWNANKFYVAANAIASIYDCLVLLLRKGSPIWKLVMILDWLMTTLLIASFTTAANTFKELKTGVPEAGWSPQCNIFPHFCNFVLVALGCGCIKLALSLPIFLFSFHVLLSP